MAATSSVHTLYQVIVGADVYDQITTSTLNHNFEEILLSGDGAVDPTFVAVMAQKPVLSFSTTAVKTALGYSALSGDSWTAGGASFYFRKVTEGGTRPLYSAVEHISIVPDEGMIIPRRISASQGQVASIDYDVVIASTDGLIPLAVTASQTVPVDTAVGEAYTVGAIAINGTAIKGVQSVTIDFGITELVQAGDGATWPTFVAIMERKPFITFTTPDLDLYPTWTAAGAAQTDTDSTVTLTALTEGAATRGTPITFTIDESIIRYDTIGGGHGEPQMATCRISPTFDGTAAIIAITGI